MNDLILERRSLGSLLAGLARSPRQTSRFFEADVEILRPSVSKPYWLGVSTDSVADEISGGLYRLPETWAWMSIMSSVSDLAVSGCAPVGVLLSCQWKFGLAERLKRRFFTAAALALGSSGTFLLGGDSGSADGTVITSTIIGEAKVPPLTRVGVLAGDRLFLVGSGSTGVGPALAARFLLGAPGFPETWLRPLPRGAEIRRARKFLRASIDSSDGIMAAASTLAILNQLHLDLTFDVRSLNPRARRFAARHGIPPAWLWLNDLGDLQGLVAVPPENVARVRRLNPDWLEIGVFGNGDGVSLNGVPVPAKLIHHDARSMPELRRHFRATRKFVTLISG